MRLLKLVLIALGVAVALTAGLVVTAIIFAGLAVFVVARRLLRQASRTEPAKSIGQTSRANSQDVIEVTATEVPLDPSTR